MGVSIQDNDRLWQEITHDLKGLDKSSVSVGFFSDDTREGGLSQAQVAAWNEYGNDRIPERPFMRPAVAGALGAIKQKQEEAYASVIMQKRSVKMALGGIGEFVKREIQKKIREVKDPKNADSTIARKGSDNPLIDTGSMRQSVTYKVNL